MFSSTVFRFLSEVFSYRLGFSELGLTDWFVLQIARWESRYRTGQVEIYKMSWPIESLWGNDIDLFIQNSGGTYDWYVLQAKVMSANGAFEDLKVRPNAAPQQWHMLMNHELLFGSLAYYLLYSGHSRRFPAGIPTRADCDGIPPIGELGLGIVEASVIASIRTHTLRPAQKLYFRHVFPDHVDSIRRLFCCTDANPRSSRQFQRNDIDTRGYIRVVYDPDATLGYQDGEEDELDKSEPVESKDGRARVRMIIHSVEATSG